MVIIACVTDCKGKKCRHMRITFDCFIFVVKTSSLCCYAFTFTLPMKYIYRKRRISQYSSPKMSNRLVLTLVTFDFISRQYLRRKFYWIIQVRFPHNFLSFTLASFHSLVYCLLTSSPPPLFFFLFLFLSPPLYLFRNCWYLSERCHSFRCYWKRKHRFP